MACPEAVGGADARTVAEGDAVSDTVDVIDTDVEGHVVTEFDVDDDEEREGELETVALGQAELVTETDVVNVGGGE